MGSFLSSCMINSDNSNKLDTKMSEIENLITFGFTDISKRLESLEKTKPVCCSECGCDHRS